MENSRAHTLKEYHKFYNVFAYKFKEYTKTECLYLASEILQMQCSETQKLKLLPLLINEMYQIITAKRKDHIKFWRIVDYLSGFLEVVDSEESHNTIFKTLNCKCIELWNNGIKKLNLEEKKTIIDNPITKEGKICICEDRTQMIRKTQHCVNCEREVHRKCFSWKGGCFMCPYCILENYDPFYINKKSIFQPQILQNKHMYQFYIKDEDFGDDNFLLIKCIRIDHRVNEKYNECEMNFPQKATVKLNQTLLENYRPDKPSEPPRKDRPLIISLSRNAGNCIKKGLNSLLCEFDEDQEDCNTQGYIFNIYICECKAPSEVLESILALQSADYNIKKSKDFIETSFNDLDTGVEVKIPLIDPMTLRKIRYPARGDACTHMNVFCLESYLMGLEKAEYRRMKCPSCSKLILKFKIDFYVLGTLLDYIHLLGRYNMADYVTFRKDMTYYFEEIEVEPDSEPEPEPESLNVNKPLVEDCKSSERSGNNPVDNDESSTEQINEEGSDDSFNIDSGSEKSEEKNKRQRRNRSTRPTNGAPPRGRSRGPKLTSAEFQQHVLQSQKDYQKQLQLKTNEYSSEEQKIIESLRAFYNEKISDKVILDSYYEALQLGKRVSYKITEDIQEENLKRIK